jgi:hypothetical protein
MYIRQEQGGPVIPPDIGFPLCHLLLQQGCSGGILTLPQPGGPGPLIYIPQEQNGPAQSQSHVTSGGQSIIMSWCLVHAALEGLHPNKFQSDIRRGTFRQNCLCYH